MKTVAIIGAGISGLTALKCCLEDELAPVCFEMKSSIGGVWHYTDQVREGEACVAKSTITNWSKEMLCFSDYPMPDDFPNYMHHRKMLEYIRMYAEQYNLAKYIQFDTQILSVKLAEDFDETGRWLVETLNRTSGKRTSAVYDCVIVGNGHHAEPLHPELPGKEIFQGKIIHGKEFRDQCGYEDKRVLIIGLGNTGADAAGDLCTLASQVYVSTNNGVWLMPRTASGLPIDAKVSRYTTILKSLLPTRLYERMLINLMNSKFDHDIYPLRPTGSAEEYVVNDDLHNHVIRGSVIVKSGVARLSTNGVHFDDGSYVSDVDVIICTTGYLVTFPFLDENIVSVHDNAVNLYRLIFPPHMRHHTLAVIGAMQVNGAQFPVIEMQSRWACKVFKGDYQLPSKEQMYKKIADHQKEIAHVRKNTLRNTLLVQWLPYMDELAIDIGCKPNIGE